MENDYCPHCGVSLIGEPIPENIRQHYSPPYYWKREIGIEDPEVYDGIMEWKCPDCEGIWSVNDENGMKRRYK